MLVVCSWLYIGIFVLACVLSNWGIIILPALGAWRIGAIVLFVSALMIAHDLRWRRDCYLRIPTLLAWFGFTTIVACWALLALASSSELVQENKEIGLLAIRTGGPVASMHDDIVQLKIGSLVGVRIARLLYDMEAPPPTSEETAFHIHNSGAVVVYGSPSQYLALLDVSEPGNAKLIRVDQDRVRERISLTSYRRLRDVDQRIRDKLLGSPTP